jgi:uncharacterized protein YjdB
MKKLLTSAIALSIAGNVFASLPDSGYYRCHNYKSDRYVYVLDNKGKIDYGATSLELYAIQLWKGLDKTISDPSTILYFDKQSDGKYDINSQGTGINDIINYYVSIKEVSSIPGAYYLYGTYSGVTKYLSDGEQDDYYQLSYLSDSGSGQWRYWTIDPLNTSGSNYFGLSPEISVGKDYYVPFYADFPFSTASDGMKVYYVSKVDTEVGMAVMTEINGVVPRSMPVIIKCSSANTSNNRLDIGGQPSAKVSDNLLKGVYFQNPDNYHYNQLDYKPNTMRLLGVTSDGSIGYIKSNTQYVPRNQAYLSVSSDAPDELKLVTLSEYEEYLATHPKVVNVTGLSFNRSTLSLKAGNEAYIAATVTPENATNKNLIWESSDTSVATVSDYGKVTAVAVGTATITAKTLDGTDITASCDVTVIPTQVASIDLNISKKELKVGESFTLTANVNPETATNKKIVWSSSNSKIAIVSDTGTVTAMGIGTAIISSIASDDSGTKSECEVTVVPTLASAIKLDKKEASVYIGNSFTLSATISPDNVTYNTIKWESANTDIATVSDTGIVTAVGIGETIVTAKTTDGSNLSEQCKVIVLPIIATSITINKAEITGVVNTNIPLSVTILPDNTTNKNVTWTTSDDDVASVTTDGIVTITGAGECDITATTTDGSKLSANCHVIGLEDEDIEVLASSINLSKEDYTATVGTEFEIIATIIPDETHIKDVVWTSSDNSVATVSHSGLVKIVGVGRCYIIATTLDGTNLSARCRVTGEAQLAKSLTLSENEYEDVIGSRHTLTATILPENTTSSNLIWKSSDTNIATVSDNGEVEILAIGTTLITVKTTDGSNLSAKCLVTGIPQLATNIELDMTDVSSKEGNTVQITATVYPENTTNKTLVWESSNEQIATVDQTGLINILSTGTCIITATTTDGSDISATCTVLGLSALETLYANPDVRCDIYTIDGIKIRLNADMSDLKLLSHGLYIIIIDGVPLKVIL